MKAWIKPEGEMPPNNKIGIESPISPQFLEFLEEQKMALQSQNRLKLFKYLKRKYAQRMMSKGEVRIGTLSYYRNTENEAIADKDEGNMKFTKTFDDDERIQNPRDFEIKMGLPKGSFMNFQGGTIILKKGASLEINYDSSDVYIYCASKNNNQELKNKFNADCCVEILDVQGFLDIISEKLSKLGLIYPGLIYPRLSRVEPIEYIGRSIIDGNKLSGYWRKDQRYANEAEVRFVFFPIFKKDGVIIQPTNNKDKSTTLPSDFDTFTLQSQTIKCKEIIKCCRLME